MLTLNSSFIALSAAMTVGLANSQTLLSREQVEKIFQRYEPYALRIDTALTEKSSLVGLDNGICTGFLIAGTKNRVGTALHCLKKPLEEGGGMRLVGGKIVSDPKIIPYTFSIEGKTGRIICDYPEADIAILEVGGEIQGKIAPTIPVSSITIGRTYTSILSNQNGGFTPINTDKFKIKFPTRIFTQGTVIDISTGVVEDKESGIKKLSGVEFLFTNNSPKGGFSGGPLITENGEIIGIWSFMDGSFGAASSISNLKTLLKRDECK